MKSNRKIIARYTSRKVFYAKSYHSAFYDTPAPAGVGEKDFSWQKVSLLAS